MQALKLFTGNANPDLARALLAALWRGRPQRAYNASDDSELKMGDYFDLAANWAVTEKASVLVGINNFTYKDPPLSSAVGTTGNGNTYPQTYDALGRWIFLRGTLSF